MGNHAGVTSVTVTGVGIADGLRGAGFSSILELEGRPKIL
jgi:hypothetical protein